MFLPVPLQHVFFLKNCVCSPQNNWIWIALTRVWVMLVCFLPTFRIVYQQHQVLPSESCIAPPSSGWIFLFSMILCHFGDITWRSEKKTTNRKVQVQVVSMCNHYGLGHHPWFIIFLNKHHPLLQMFAMTQWEFPCSEVIFRITWFSPFWKSCKLDANGQKKNLCQEKSSIGSGVSAGNTGIACTLLGIPKEPQMTCHEWLDAWWNEVIQVTLWHWEEISGKFDMLDIDGY